MEIVHSILRGKRDSNNGIFKHLIVPEISFLVSFNETIIGEGRVAGIQEGWQRDFHAAAVLWEWDGVKQQVVLYAKAWSYGVPKVAEIGRYELEEQIKITIQPHYYTYRFLINDEEKVLLQRGGRDGDLIEGYPLWPQYADSLGAPQNIHIKFQEV